MIRDIFMPKVVGSYYIFSQRIIGFDIGKTFIQATLVKAYKNTRTIEKSIRERISEEVELSYEERVSKAIIKVIAAMGPYDLVFTSLPTGLTIFKELTVPFTSIDMMDMVVPYEVESLLPFSLESASIDFIVTKSYIEEKKSDILVAAVKKEIVAQHVQFFAAAGIDLERVTIDFFEFYAMYKAIPYYNEQAGIVALVDSGFYATRIALIIDGQLKYIRSLSRGILSLAQDSNQQHLVFEKEKLQQFMTDIQFTIQPFSERYQGEKAAKIIFTGHGAEIQGFVEVVIALCGHNCELFNFNKIVQNSSILFAPGQIITQGCMVSLATALSLSATRHINLEKTVTTTRDEKLLSWQIITSFLLSLCIVGALSLNIWFASRKYTQEIEKSTQEALTLLKIDFGKLRQAKGKITLAKANTLAEDEVKKEESILSQLLRKNRISFLACLEELSQRIDREALGFDLAKLSFNESHKSVILDGRVRGYKELAILEQSLRRSKMFIFDGPKLQEISFEIKLLINEDYGKE